MKISVLTPTYNRGEFLKKLYYSLVTNSKYNIQIEWLIMDDGSNDRTRDIINELLNLENSEIDIKYFYQENQGKMVAINNIVGQATGDLIIDCDSDDYFTDDAFEIVKNAYQLNKNEDKQLYGLCFLKYDTNGENMGKNFKKEKTTMFDLYFKEGEDGEKSLVFYSDIRKQYKHELEHREKFVTEARMYHKMDEKYKIICINKPIMICEYQAEGYSNNIINEFKNNPYGYYEYFKEIFKHNFKDVTFKKRLYAIKHYILFSCFTKQYSAKNVKGILNKILYFILFIPGNIKSRELIR